MRLEARSELLEIFAEIQDELGSEIQEDMGEPAITFDMFVSLFDNSCCTSPTGTGS